MQAKHHKPLTASQVERIALVKELEQQLSTISLSGREHSIGITNLETACMWIIKSISKEVH